MNIAYADPPYIGQAMKKYRCEEVDHKLLLEKLVTYDGWALSCSSPTLKDILPLCPLGIRVAAWVKPFCIFKPGVNPAYAWEPVIFVPARKHTRQKPTIRDWVSANITLKRGLCGAKPEAFSLWLFSLLGAEPGDKFFDLFLGTGAVSIAWDKFSGEKDLNPALSHEGYESYTRG